MSRSVECLKELIQTNGEDWKRKLDLYLKDEEECEEDEELLFEFLAEYKEDVIANNYENICKIAKLIDNDLLLESLKIHIDNRLGIYYATEPLRVMEVKDYAKAKKMVDFVFSQSIVRHNPQAVEKYDEFELSSEEIFGEIIAVMVALSEFAVSKNFTVEAITQVTYDNMRLSKKMCDYVAGKLDENFDAIRFKMILEKLGK